MKPVMPISSHLRELLALGLPLIGSNIAQLALHLTNTVMLGWYDVRALAAAALDRMEQGEYGFCVTCGKRISEERLDILPHTPFCKDDAI